jgi:transposase
MRFVPVKTIEQQGILMVHRTRSLLVRQRTMAANALRAHLAEFGFVANPGIVNLVKLAERAFAEQELPPYAHTRASAAGHPTRSMPRKT